MRLHTGEDNTENFKKASYLVAVQCIMFLVKEGMDTRPRANVLNLLSQWQ